MIENFLLKEMPPNIEQHCQLYPEQNEYKEIYENLKKNLFEKSDRLLILDSIFYYTTSIEKTLEEILKICDLMTVIRNYKIIFKAFVSTIHICESSGMVTVLREHYMIQNKGWTFVSQDPVKLVENDKFNLEIFI